MCSRVHATIFFPGDSTDKDTIKNQQYRDRYGNPFTNPRSISPFILSNPSNVVLEVELDASMEYYHISEKIGTFNYRNPTIMSFEEYSAYKNKQMIRNYFKQKSSELGGESVVSSRSTLIPKIYLSPVMDRIFGGSYVDIRPNGAVSLKFGGQWQRLHNPAISVKQQRTGGFDFDQSINMNVIGKIGEKLKLNVNWDTDATFEFENNIKIQYTAFEEDILQKIEAGYVSMPVKSSLIRGSQNLFGIKTQLRFGRLDVTAIVSSQRGRTEEITITGGAQTREFEIKCADYDENRHFFLAQYFRDQYENALNNIPIINSPVNISRVEVYLINRSNATVGLKDIVALSYLGEDSISIVGTFPDNNNINNNLYNSLPYVRNPDNTSSTLEAAGYIKGEDFEFIRGARKLQDKEFSYHPQLGFISLNSSLRPDELLAVSFEYTVAGGTKFQVGELNPYPSDSVIILKLLKPTSIRTSLPMWDLMMKNVYSLNAGQVSKEGFELKIYYKDDATGIDNPSLHEGTNLKDKPLIEVMNLDRLNSNGDGQKDGNFDFVEGITIDVKSGKIFFPVLEPFGSHLGKFFVDEDLLKDKYLYDSLYTSTKSDAETKYASKNKFLIKGKYQSSSSSEIMLPGINISPGSVVITAGNTPLVENVDYTVNYNMGRVKITNEGILASGKEIKITYEKADLFNFQTRSLFGARFDFRVSKDINIGATIFHLNERPFISRVSIGDEPTKNTIWGADINYRKESRFLTKLIDKLPIIQTKAPSSITLSGEFAQLIPGSQKLVGGEKGTAYIDDFEGAETPYDYSRVPTRWKLASTPSRFAEVESNTLDYSKHRAKMAWYTIDNLFYRENTINNPKHIKDALKNDPKTNDQMTNHYIRAISPREIFPNRDPEVFDLNEYTFDIAYFPQERGQYNYNTVLNKPEDNWGGIMRSITYNTDFDDANIQFIEFWLMDPFISNANGNSVIDDKTPSAEPNTTGGELYFNLGNISEDVMKDSKHTFENGLPSSGTSIWGTVPTKKHIINAFDNTEGERPLQDVGLDGLNDIEEQGFFNDPILGNDPSSDNFKYYLDGNDEFDYGYDGAEMPILGRYKNFNGMDGNSPESSGGSFTPASTTIPDNEDLNNDNTISDLEAYYEYKIKLSPGLKIGENFIVDRVKNTINGDVVSWYLFRIPIKEKPQQGGKSNIEGFKSIRFMRMFLTSWSQPVVLRFVDLQLVANQWRKYPDILMEPGMLKPPEPPFDANFNVSTVNIYENGASTGDNIPYVLPPGIQQDIDFAATNDRQLNEQSLQLCVDSLMDRDARAVYKNVGMDFINYGRLKMFIHAESDERSDLAAKNGEVEAFIRLGSDFIDNYYEYRVLLTITNPASTAKEEIWPESNWIDVAFDDFGKVKSERNNQEFNISWRFTSGNITVVGNPDLSDVQTIMIGIRNPGSKDGDPKSVCIWVNELRVSDFDKNAGWATIGRINVKLADLATVTASGKYTTVGFGSIQQKISQRSRANTAEFDISSNITLDKFIPKKAGIKLPMFVSYEIRNVDPKFDPLDKDIPLAAKVRSFGTTEKGEITEEGEKYRKMAQDRTVRRSLNMTNIRKVKTKKNEKRHIYDIENLSLTLAYSDVNSHNINTASYELKTYRAGLGWGFSPKAKNIEPFKKVKFLKSPVLQLVKDFNFTPFPSSLTFRTDLNRRFQKTQLRNSDLTTVGIDPTYEKSFLFNRLYALKWNLTKSLSYDYSATANSVIDEPFGDIDTQEKKDSLIDNIIRFDKEKPDTDLGEKDWIQFGRMKQFTQTNSFNYRLPLNKFPLTNWINASVSYTAGYSWKAGSNAKGSYINSSGILTEDTLTLAERLGNSIQNTSRRAINGKIDLVKLYNKVKFLKAINSTPRRKPPAKTKKPKTPIAKDTTKTKKKPELKVFKAVLRSLMTARSVNFSYSVNRGTAIPGFMRKPDYFGLESGTNAPGLPFVLGSQDVGIKQEIAQRGWLSDDSSLFTTFAQFRNENLTLNTSLEPFKGFRIKLDAKKNKSADYQELFTYDPITEEFMTSNPNKKGSYSISYIAINTSFIRDRKSGRSTVFENFIRNRSNIINRLAADNPNKNGNYSENSQDVLIPAFLAAYTNKDPLKINTSPFPLIPLPNWRIDYSGLSKLKPLKKYFSSINLSHSYSCSYSVSSYTTALDYNNLLDLLTLQSNVENYPYASKITTNKEFIPVYVINNISIKERFSPLIGIKVRTKSKMTINISYKKQRNLSLDLSNTQVTEVKNQDLVLGWGFTKKNVKVPFKVRGETVILKNDLAFKFNLTLRDSKTTLRSFDQEPEITAGNKIIQIEPTLSYKVNKRLNVQLFFTRAVTDPRLSSSFKNARTEFGTNIRFNLSQ
ncbi:MAG: cell surface protein SprA [Cytophagales bacterium]|nr:cell surface protein SprA [Cytophagales bacterium]